MVIQPIIRLLDFIVGTNWLDFAFSNPLFSILIVISVIALYLGDCCEECEQENWAGNSLEKKWYCINSITNRFCHDYIDQYSNLIRFGAIALIVFSIFYAPFSPIDFSPDSGAHDDAVVRPPSELSSPRPQPNFRVNFVENGVTKCGISCRRVNATAIISNTGSRLAEDVVITLTLKGKLLTSHTIWSGDAKIGQLAPNEIHRETRTVTFDGTDLTSVKQNGCAIDYTIEIRHATDKKTIKGTTPLEKNRCEVL